MTACYCGEPLFPAQHGDKCPGCGTVVDLSRRAPYCVGVADDHSARAHEFTALGSARSFAQLESAFFDATAVVVRGGEEIARYVGGEAA